MDILSTVEARWFIEDISGRNAAAARSWFAGVSPEGAREDRYLVTGREDIGFKARVQEGRPAKIETKYLLGSLGPAMLHERFVGNVERWCKLSLDASDPALEQRGEWMNVTKVRRTRHFAYEGGVVKSVTNGAPVDAGCLVELTELDVRASSGSRRALTVGLEAFGPTERLLDVLLRVCEHALEAAKDLRLGFEHTSNYPGWLARLATGPV